MGKFFGDYLGTLPASTHPWSMARLPDGTLLLANPEHPPWRLTRDGKLKQIPEPKIRSQG